MELQEFRPGDLVEVVRLSTEKGRVLGGSSGDIRVGEHGTVVEIFDLDLRVVCGKEGHLQWEANLRPDEVRLVERAEHSVADRRIRAIHGLRSTV